MTTDPTKRRFIRNSLFGAGLLGLRALASGLPISLLANPHKASADTAACPPNAVTAPQYLILSTSGGGDPLNANVPGCYVNPNIYHPADPPMAPTNMTIGGGTTRRRAAVDPMAPSILSRTCFFHHATYTNAHGDAPKVNRLMGAVQRQEMLVSLIAKNLAPRCARCSSSRPSSRTT